MTGLAVRRDGTCLPAAASCWQRFAYEWDELGQLSRARRWDLAAASPDERTPYAHTADPLPPRAANAELSYAYDAGGGRVLKSAVDGAGTTKHTVYVTGSIELRSTTWDAIAGDYVLDATTASLVLPAGPVVARVVYGEASLPNVTSGQQHVFLQFADQLGSTTFTVDRATGELVEFTTYQPYGATESNYRPGRWNNFREPYKFGGKEEDIEVGLAYFGARYYSPYLGVWLSPDPVTIHDLGSDLNPYAYVRGSPLMGVDPDGRELITILAIAAISAVVSAGSNAVAQAAANHWDFGKVNWGLKGVAGAAIVGAVSGAVGAGVGSLPCFALRSVVGGTLAGGAGYLTSVAVQGGTFSLSDFGKSMAVGAISGGVSDVVGSSRALSDTFGSFGASAIGGLAGTAAGSATSVALGGHLSATDFAISVGSSLASAAANEGLLGSCFVAGTPVHTTDAIVAIEEVALGERVAADESLCADIDVTGWLRYDFVGTSDESFRVSMLRPSPWGTGLAVGALLFLTMSEFGVADWVRLVRVQGAAVDVGGQGCPVITTFTRAADDVIALSVEGDESPLGVTSQHRFYSADRAAWVRAEELQAGERLVTRGGTTRVREVDTSAPVVARVFNLEVAGAHTYFVGESGAWAHNFGCPQQFKQELEQFVEVANEFLHDVATRTAQTAAVVALAEVFPPAAVVVAWSSVSSDTQMGALDTVNVALAGPGSTTAPLAASGRLSNAEVRAWYAERVRSLDTSGPLTRETAARVHAARNALKAEGRAMMADRAAAAELDVSQPRRSLEYYVEKYTAEGFSGERLWQRIIEGGTTPNAAVNAAHGVR